MIFMEEFGCMFNNVKGVCMIIGGLKHAEQSFNPRTAGVSSTLLFVSVAGAFAPTLFAISYPPSVASNTTCMVYYRVDFWHFIMTLNDCHHNRTVSMFQLMLEPGFIVLTASQMEHRWNY